MSDWDEKAADAAIEYAKPTMRPVQTMSDHMADAFHDGARWQREALLSDEAIKRAALGIQASHDRGDWDEERPEVQEEYLDMARACWRTTSTRKSRAMSERVPGVEDIRQALRGDGWTLDEADEGIDRIKQRGIGIGHEMARETMQASIGDAVRKLQEIAWDEGQGATELADNPYRKDKNDE